MRHFSTGVIVFAAVTLLVVLAFKVRVGGSADSVAILKTAGMTCGACSDKISSALQTLPGVAATETDLDAGVVMVGYDRKKTSPQSLAARVTAAGFPSTVAEIMSAEQYKATYGKSVGIPTGCCAGREGCGTKKP